MDRKQKIGRRAAMLVGDRETIIIDSGTTTTQFAENLKSRQELNIITNALNIALMLGANPVQHRPHARRPVQGADAVAERREIGGFLRRHLCRKAVPGDGRLSFEAGLTYPAIGDIYVKRAMIKAASKVYLLANSTKIGRTSFSALGGIELVDTLITDDQITEQHLTDLRARGIEVIVAS